MTHMLVILKVRDRQEGINKVVIWQVDDTDGG